MNHTNKSKVNNHNNFELPLEKIDKLIFDKLSSFKQIDNNVKNLSTNEEENIPTYKIISTIDKDKVDYILLENKKTENTSKTNKNENNSNSVYNRLYYNGVSSLEKKNDLINKANDNFIKNHFQPNISEYSKSLYQEVNNVYQRLTNNIGSKRSRKDNKENDMNENIGIKDNLNCNINDQNNYNKKNAQDYIYNNKKDIVNKFNDKENINFYNMNSCKSYRDKNNYNFDEEKQNNKDNYSNTSREHINKLNYSSRTFANKTNYTSKENNNDSKIGKFMSDTNKSTNITMNINNYDKNDGLPEDKENINYLEYYNKCVGKKDDSSNDSSISIYNKYLYKKLMNVSNNTNFYDSSSSNSNNNNMRKIGNMINSNTAYYINKNHANENLNNSGNIFDNNSNINNSYGNIFDNNIYSYNSTKFNNININQYKNNILYRKNNINSNINIKYNNLTGIIPGSSQHQNNIKDFGINGVTGGILCNIPFNIDNKPSNHRHNSQCSCPDKNSVNYSFKPKINKNSIRLANKKGNSKDRLLMKNQNVSCKEDDMYISKNKNSPYYINKSLSDIDLNKNKDISKYINLYEKGEFFKKKKEYYIKIKKEEKMLKDKDIYTFYPRTNQFNDPNYNFIENNKQLLLKKNQKILSLKKSLRKKEKEELTFEPDLKKKKYKDDIDNINKQVPYINDYIKRRRNNIYMNNLSHDYSISGNSFDNSFEINERKFIIKYTNKISEKINDIISKSKSKSKEKRNKSLNVLYSRNKYGLNEFYTGGNNNLRNNKGNGTNEQFERSYDCIYNNKIRGIRKVYDNRKEGYKEIYFYDKNKEIMNISMDKVNKNQLNQFQDKFKTKENYKKIEENNIGMGNYIFNIEEIRMPQKKNNIESYSRINNKEFSKALKVLKENIK